MGPGPSAVLSGLGGCLARGIPGVGQDRVALSSSAGVTVQSPQHQSGLGGCSGTRSALPPPLPEAGAGPWAPRAHAPGGSLGEWEPARGGTGGSFGARVQSRLLCGQRAALRL